MLKSHQKTILEILGRSPIHPFPARMAPGIAFDALAKCDTPLRVLDPMAGSGTVLAVARANGHRAFGVDLDPLAVLLSTVWTRTIDSDQVRDKAQQVLTRARRTFELHSSAMSYPIDSDEETRRFIRFWFDEYARRQLAALSSSIRRVRDETLRDVLWIAFSRLIITKKSGASLAMDLSHSRPHKSFTRAPIKPFNRFLTAVETVSSNCLQRGSEMLGPPTVVKKGDARKLDVDTSSIDLVLSSPPYLNAIDYMRCSKFSLVWMGYNICQLRAIRSSSVGAEIASQKARDSSSISELIQNLKLQPGLSTRQNAMLAQYVFDMELALGEASRVLRKTGRAVYVVGDSTVCGTFIRNSEIVRRVAEAHNLKLESKQTRSLPDNRRYLPPPQESALKPNTLDARMRREVVLVFRKTSV